MNRGLVLVDRTDRHAALLREAAEHARGVDADLVLLSVLTEDEYNEDASTLASVQSVGDHGYDSNAVLEAAERGIDEFVDANLSESFDYETVARAAEEDRAPVVLAVAEEMDCDHVYVLGRKRSPTGKAIFGDFAQRIVLNFDGYTTITMSQGE